MLAAEQRHGDPGGTQPRFAVQAAQLRVESARDSVDGRYRLQSRLQAAPAGAQQGSDLRLRAKVELAGAALCGDGTDTLFANGFE